MFSSLILPDQLLLMIAFTHVCWQAHVNVIEVTSAELEIEQFVIHCIYFLHCLDPFLRREITWGRVHESYKLGLTAGQVVRLIGLLLVFASQKSVPHSLADDYSHQQPQD